MKALVVYESMYGNTHLIASAIADGLREHADTTVVAVYEVDASLVSSADVIVVGGPTHAHGMSRPVTRDNAVAAAEKPDAELVLDGDPDAYGLGLREWFASLSEISARAAAFDTRADMPAAFTGRASKGIARKLRHLGADLIDEPQSFFVTKANHLEPDEEARAREWGGRLALSLESLHR